MHTIAYLSNLFPSPLEPYVVDEILELRRRGITVVPSSLRKAQPGPDKRLQTFAAETLYLQPLRPTALLRAAGLCIAKCPSWAAFSVTLFFPNKSPSHEKSAPLSILF